MFIAKFAFIIYNLYKININNEKFLKKLIIFVVEIDLIT